MPQVILLTGASSGIGYDTAKDLAAAGHTVYGAARRVEKLEELRPFGIIPLQLDITDERLHQEGCRDQLLPSRGASTLLLITRDTAPTVRSRMLPIDEARNQFEVNLFWAGTTHAAYPAADARAVLRAHY